MINYSDQHRAITCQNHRHNSTREITPVVMKLVDVTEKDGTLTQSFYCPKCSQVVPAPKEFLEKIANMNKVLDEEATKKAEADKAKQATEAELTPEGHPKTLGVVATEHSKVDAVFGRTD